MTRTSNTRTAPTRRLLALALATLMVTSLFAGVAVAVPESESNDTFQDADPILGGGATSDTVTGSLDQDDEDFFSFRLQRGQHVEVRTTVPTSNPEGYRLTLYRDTAGVSGAFVSPGNSQTYGATATADATYYVEIDGDAGSYSFDVEIIDPGDVEPNNDFPDAVAISPSPGSPATGSGELYAEDEDFFSFEVERGQQIEVTTTVPSSAPEGYRLTLYRDTSGVSGSFVSPGNSRTYGSTVLADGTYHVEIDGDVGSYSFDVEIIEPNDVEPNDDFVDAVPLNATVGAAVTGSGELYAEDEDFFSFEVERGQQVEVRTTVPSSATEGYRLTLYRDTAGVSGSFVSPGNSQTYGATALRNETYYVEIDGDVGSYSFDVELIESLDPEPNNDFADAVPINATGTASGELFPEDEDFFSFPVTRGQQVVVSTTVPSSAAEGYRLTLYRDTAGVSGAFVSPGTSRTFGATATANETYHVEIDGDAGTYSFDVDTRTYEATEPNNEFAEATRLFENPREPTLRGVLVVEDEDFYRVPASVGDAINVTATVPSSAAEGYRVTLYREDTGVDAGFVGVGRTTEFATTVDADVPYYVEVDGDVGESDLVVTVAGEVVGLANDRFEPNENASDAAAPGFGQLAELRIVDDDVDVFAYDLDSGDTLTGRLTYSATGEALTLAVLDANGAVQATADPAGSGVPLEFVAPSDGTYYLRVTGDGDGSVPYALAARVPTRVSVGFDPATATVTPGESTTVDVVVGGTNAGIGAYDFVVSVDNTSVATVESVQPLGATAGAVVTVAPDGSGATVNVSDASLSGDGSLAIARVTLNATADGTTTTSVSAASVRDAAGFDYVVNAVDGEVVASTGPGVVVGDLPARDLDGDGLYDDVDGDGVSDLDDVFALAFDVLPLALQRPELVPFFDFDADGDVDLDDVFELAFS
jgi:hypothetical protein